MEAVVDAAAVLSKHGDTKVKDVVLEGRVMDEEVETECVILRPSEEVAKVGSPFKIELRAVGSFGHQNQMGHFNAHVIDFQSIFVWNQLVFFPILFDESPPLSLCDEFLLVDDKEEDQN
jgi:hypothetical protein